MNKISLEDFIKKGLEKSEGIRKEADIEIEGYGSITFVRPTEDNILEYLDAQANAIKMNKNEEIIGTDYKLLANASKEFIYFSCPFLQNPELHKAWGIKDPLDAPVKAFGVENLAGIAKKIKEAFGDGKKTKEKLKN
ncbi:hypothetical protein [Clostridium beijerinckii]|uniref:hypothetical protein n=1 Tax=Clostridium beijerinckii TaxID=1520 RepID=UPI000303DD29|nr:hypothetical protein [Clostridium beijerinckii]